MKFLNTPFKVNLLLFICSFSIYFIYFYPILLHLNSILSGVNGDTLKNYFTYLYNIKNDESFMHFMGQNYPYGEHVIFIDCQPILTFILRLLPFTHDYLIGILHALIFLSFIITPLILNKIFLRLKLDAFTSFFLSLGITLLSPQYFKVLAGHYALAYTCIIPFCILLLLKTFEDRSKKNLVILFLFNLTLFFLHPYLGLGTSVFCFINFFVLELVKFSKKNILPHTLQNLFVSILPIILFRLFVALTDKHLNRSLEPENVNTLIANTGSLVLPNFGPFRDLLPKIFKVNTSNFEGFSYLGIALILVTFLSLFSLPFIRKKLIVSKESLVIFISAVLLIFPAFGLHNDLQTALHIKVAALDQFRASGRFIWFFYYSFPLFLFPFLYHSLKNKFENKDLRLAFRLGAVIFFCLNLWEADSLFKLDRAAYWKYKNIFNEKYLSVNEKELIETIKKSKFQAIIPLSLYATGSDVYARPESETMLYSMMYSFHCRLPVIGCFTTRTSATETEEVIGVLNAYKKEHKISSLIKGRGDFLLLRSRDALMPDEERMYTKGKSFYKDSLLEALILKEDLLFKKVVDPKIVRLESNQNTTNTSENILYIKQEDRKPFITSSLNDYETIYTLESNKFMPGTYIVSLHYYYKERTLSALACNMIVNREFEGKGEWFYNTQLKCFSGFYDGYAVFEQKINIDKDTKYDFMLKGLTDRTYKISDFMLRPEGTSVVVLNGRDSTTNNFAD